MTSCADCCHWKRYPAGPLLDRTRGECRLTQTHNNRPRFADSQAIARDPVDGNGAILETTETHWCSQWHGQGRGPGETF